MNNKKTFINQEENYRKLKEGIRLMKTDDKPNEEEGKKIETNKINRENNKNA